MPDTKNVNACVSHPTPTLFFKPALPSCFLTPEGRRDQGLEACKETDDDDDDDDIDDDIDDDANPLVEKPLWRSSRACF